MFSGKKDIFSQERLDSLWRFACSILMDSEEAKDVVQDVMLKAWARPFPIVNPEAYLIRGVRNACIDRLRLRKEFTKDIPEAPEENLLEQMSIKETVRYAIGRLPDNQRMVVHLKEIEGYSTQEIAQMMGLQENHIRVLLSRGRQAMRVILEKEIGYEI